jgi:hypothetical protein
MEHLIKLYSRILGETIHLKSIFLNSFSFHHLSQSAQQSFNPEYPVEYESQQDKSFCWLFFAMQPTKNYI